MKILTVIGARPQFIKAAAVSRALKKAGLQEIIVHTGQHYDENMSEVFFREMEIPAPNYNLGVNDLSHGAMTGRMLEQIEKLLIQEKPDYTVVYGDTNSTLAGALAAVKLHIPVAHVEAGLRSFNMRMPEEVNRIMTDRISKILFCPTAAAVANLEKEGAVHLGAEIIQCGDVMLDTLKFYKGKLQGAAIIAREKLSRDGFILATIHRAENTDNADRLRNIVDAINEINQSIPVVLPLHPRTKSLLAKNNLSIQARVIDPVGYFDMLALLDNARMVMTDSGGLQKESYFCGKFCVTLRDQTEWVELVDAGANVLAGADRQRIVAAINANLTKKPAFDDSLYGDGNASGKIADRLKIQ